MAPKKLGIRNASEEKRKKDVKKMENFFRKAGEKVRLGMTGKNTGRRYRRKSSGRLVLKNEGSADDDGCEEVSLVSDFGSIEMTSAQELETEHSETLSRRNDSNSASGARLKNDLWFAVSCWEGSLRNLLALIGAFSFGASFGAGSLDWVLSIASFVALFWMMSLYAKTKRRSIDGTILRPESSHGEHLEKSDNSLQFSLRPFDAPDPSSEQPRTESDNEFLDQHPEMMSKVFMLTGSSLERVVPNSKEYNLETDFFTGTMFLMIRTPDVDKNSSSKDFTPPIGSVAARVSDYFKDKRRQFEFQFQIKLKKLPTGPLFLGCELEQPLKLGMIQRALVSAILGVVRKMNAVHFSYGMDENGNVPSQALIEERNFELAHIAFGLEDGMDRIVVTKSGEQPPKLGDILYEDPESIKNRKKSGFGTIDWNLEDTYTMAFWSAYINFMDWKVIGLPGIRPFSITGIIGEQPLTLTLYSLPDRNARFHLRRDMATFVQLEISHAANTSGGLIEKYKALVRDTRIPENNVSAENDEEGHESDDVAIGVDVQANDCCDDEEDEISDLGDGLYMQSGDPIVLCDTNGIGMQNDSKCFVAHRSGFALLQSHEPSYKIVLEKAPRQSQSAKKQRRSALICDGDAVVIKIINSNDVRFLSTHRGCWLKFVRLPPRHNGFFYIYSHKSKDSDADEAPGVANPYIALDTPFSLRHRRWSHYEVGASDEGSARMGGRLLGLRRVTDTGANTVAGRDGNFEKPDYVDRQGQKRWLKPLHLCASLPTPCGENNASNLLTMASTEPENIDQSLLLDEVNLDASAWIEMVHRNTRRKQRAYIFRVSTKKCNSQPSSSVHVEAEDSKRYAEITVGSQKEWQNFRVRTARDITAVLQLARAIRGLGTENVLSGHKPVYDDAQRFNFQEVFDEEDQVSTNESEDQNSSVTSSESLGDVEVCHSAEQNPSAAVSEIHNSMSGEDVSPHVSALPAPVLDEFSNTNTCYMPKKNWMKAHGIERLAKSVKDGTVATRKHVVRQGLKVAHTVEKSTVIAGRAITKGIQVSGKPRETKKGKNDDLAVVKNIMKSPRGILMSDNSIGEKMSPPDQSLQSISHALADMATLANTDQLRRQVNNTIASTFTSKHDLDTWFLRGGSADIGVVPMRTAEDVSHGALVARALWDTHWREEWCGIYSSKLDFYAPLTNKPVFSLALGDIEKVRLLDLDGKRHPIPGLPLLVLETAWRCHYLAFGSLKSRENFASNMHQAIFACVPYNRTSEKEQNLCKKDKKESFRWQGYQAAIQSSLSNGRGKWETVLSSQKRKHRDILNGRCMVFDSQPFEASASQTDVETVIVRFVENLLSLALSLDQNSFTDAPEELLLFLDMTSRLNAIPIDQLNFSGKGAYCIFVNLFHCLLQHALLLSIDGPPNQRSIGHFLRCSSYEIGGDVFSLAEIESLVLRGNLSRAVNPKPPFVVAPKQSRLGAIQSLAQVDARINFILNHGTFADLPWVSVLRPETLNSQVIRLCSLFLRQEFSFDRKKKIITLPKICEVYRNDFGDASPLSSVLFCMQFLRDDVDVLMDIINDDDHSIKFNPPCCSFQYCLKPEE